MFVWMRGAYQPFYFYSFPCDIDCFVIRMLKDDRVRGDAQRSIFNVKDAADRLG